MAINAPQKQANQFWPAFLRKNVIITIITQIVISTAVIVGFVYTETLRIDSVALWLIIGTSFIANLFVSLLILLTAIHPTKDMLAALLSVSGERTNLTPPNPNEKRYERTGFRSALQTIYELSGKSEIDKTELNSPSNSDKNEILADAIEKTSCGFIAMNTERHIIYTNKSAPVNIDPSGKKIMCLIFNGSDTLDAWLDECAEHAVHEEHVWARIPDRLPNEENRRFFDVFASYEKGSTVETVLTLIDRTNIYSADEENLDFISFAAHELRGPITVIRGYLDVLNDELVDVLQDDQAELFRRLIVSSNRLSGYIDNILNTSRYDRRHLKMNLAEDSVANIYDSISDDMKLRAGSQNRLLSVEFPSDLPTVAADRASMGEVFGNLIDNAIKYSNEGGTVTVNAKVNGNFVDISVTDNGIGMPESVVSNLFQKFYRSHRSRETVAGTGIGLYISKAIVESHGGTISVRSTDGRGSIFTVSLPIYSTVADKLVAGDNSNEGLISEGTGWIKNHSMFRG